MILLQDIPQFGLRRTGTDYPDRPCAYGIGLDMLGRIAVAEIGLRPPFEYDLPGGGLDPGESPVEALVREFREETGLQVEAGDLIAKAGQYWGRADVRPRNSLCHFHLVQIAGDHGAPVEHDHRLVWLSPFDAARRMRHDAHAWAILKWLRLTEEHAHGFV